jgi:hypothetical protein
MNDSAYIKIPKKLATGFLFVLSIAALVFMNLGSANAGTTEPQPTNTTFTWASVSAATGDVNSIRGISYNGRYVLFTSTSPLLVPGDTNSATDAFVKDMDTGTATRASVDNSGAQLSSGIYGTNAVMSSDGRYVAFCQLVSSHVQVYVRDLTDNTTTLASSTSSGTMGNNDTYPLSISNDGLVMLNSWASNLVSGVSGANIFLKSVSTGSIEQLPFYDPTGAGDTWSVNNGYGNISADDSTVTIVADDTTVGANNHDEVIAEDLNDETAQVVSYVTSPSSQHVYFVNGGLSSTGEYALFKEGSATWSSTASSLFMRNLSTGAITAIDQAPSGRTNNGFAGSVAYISDDGGTVGYDSTATTLDSGYNPSQSSNGPTLSAYIDDTSTGQSSMIVNQNGGDYYFAPGSSTFAMSTTDQIDNAAPPVADSSFEIYLAQQ